MIIDKINLNHLRVFECVYRTASMTVAAQEIHLTQSGVSQHIKALEDALSVTLFDRVKHRLIPTSFASELYDKCSKGFLEIEHTLLHITGAEQELAGLIQIGMPVEFGNNVIIPLLSKFSKEHPKVHFKLKFEFAKTINDLLLDGKIDFGFVDDFVMDERIEKVEVYTEILELCYAKDSIKLKNKLDKDFFENLNYVDYDEGEPLVRKWLNHHLDCHHINLNTIAYVMDAQGIARLIQGGVGVGILPQHLIERLEEQGRSFFECFPVKNKPFKNVISLATIKGRTHSRAAKHLMSWLKQELIYLT